MQEMKCYIQFKLTDQAKQYLEEQLLEKSNEEEEMDA